MDLSHILEACCCFGQITVLDANCIERFLYLYYLKKMMLSWLLFWDWSVCLFNCICLSISTNSSRHGVIMKLFLCPLDTGHLSVIWWLPSWTRSAPLPACCCSSSSSSSSSPYWACRCSEASSTFLTNLNPAAPLTVSLRPSSLCSRYNSSQSKLAVVYLKYILYFTLSHAKSG